MEDARRLVQMFYDDVWNRRSASAAEPILADDLSFSGSLGPEMVGRAAFLDYLDMVTGALSGYTCTIERLICENEEAAAKLRFEGRHTGPFMGYAPTGETLYWAGAAFFSVNLGKIQSIWVLGDVVSLTAQLDHRERERKVDV